jgi:tRNA dimethylallyltransferase
MFYNEPVSLVAWYAMNKYRVASPSDPAEVVFIMGPTASGKTSLGIELAKVCDGEIISVDSALIYRGMDIGTAKPDAAEQSGVVHHLLDIRDPSETYSVSEFRNDTLRLIEDIRSRGKMPILVGGTMMYFNALIKGISALPAANECVRADLTEQAELKGWEAMHKRLAECDPESAQRIHPNDPQRLLRALEVFELTGRPLSELQQQNSPPIPYSVAQFAIAPEERAVLHERIRLRYEQMLAYGLIEEVKKLYKRKDLHPELPSIRCVGYRQTWQFLESELSFDEAKERGIIATRQLAKRQLTWLRGWDDVTWLNTFDAENLSLILKVIKN